MEKEITKDIVVLYHGNCPDGFTAAWAAWKKFGDEADYVPLFRYAEFPIIKGKEIYILDYCPNNPDDLKRLLSDNKSTVVIDHHISEAETIKLAKNYVFDVQHSGAFLSWKYFNPETTVPNLILHIEDYDIWKWQLPNTREINNIVQLQDISVPEFSDWNIFAENMEITEKRNDYIKQGALIQKYREVLLGKIIGTQTKTVEFEGYEVYVVNAPGIFADDLGHILATKKPPFAVVWSQTNEKIRISLRSVGDFDTTTITKKYGGGGHKGAGAFSLPTGSPFPWKIITKDEK